MMLASVVGSVDAIGCIVGKQKTSPIVPRHTLWFYIMFLCHFSAPYSPMRALQWKLASFGKLDILYIVCRWGKLAGGRWKVSGEKIYMKKVKSHLKVAVWREHTEYFEELHLIR